MASLMNLFSRRTSLQADAGGVRFSTPDSLPNRAGHDQPLHGQDIADFERLGEKQQAIHNLINEVHHGLSSVQGIANQMAFLRAAVSQNAEDHRTLALTNYSLSQDLAYTQKKLAERSAKLDAATAELAALRHEAEAARSGLERLRSDYEALEQSSHLLAVGKREAEEQLSQTISLLTAANDEVEGLRLEVGSQKELIDSYSIRTNDLTAKLNDSNSNQALLSNRCDALESSLHQKVEELLSVTERYDTVFHEKETALLYIQQKEQEVAHLRSEVSRITRDSQQDKKAREIEINQLKADVDGARSQIKMLEDIKGEAVTENEHLAKSLRRLEDQKAQADITLERLEAKLTRLSAKLEATTSAKAHLEQSRSTMSARLETVTQSFSESEADVKRLRLDIERLSAELEQQRATASDTIDGLSSKVFELEKELATQRNQTAIYLSQLESASATAVREALP